MFTAKAIRAYFEEALAEAGASLATWVVLSGIDRGRWDNQRGLARDLRIEGATLTRHLDRMEREGLIVRTRDPEDRRQVRAELTADGRTLHDTLKAIATKTGRRACDGLSADEQQMLRRLLEQIRTNVGGDDANRGAA